jgi:hypothetical protein
MKPLSLLGFAAILAAPNWPTILCAPSKSPASPATVADAAAANATLLQRLSRRAMRRARGKAKEDRNDR